MRRHNLDWLRVIVFGLLIFYHIGMFFVPWNFHIKNDILYPSLRWPMLFVNQWRLSLLFVISGMGTYYALSAKSGVEFAKERTTRLFVPLVIGMLFIVPPQVYLERIAKDQFNGSYFDFWPAQIFRRPYPEGNLSWHHLWFLPYLLLFSLVLIPAFLYFRKHPNAWPIKKVRTFASSPFGLFWLIIPLYIWESFMEPFFPSTHALIGDWFNVVNYITLFFYGFLLVSAGDIFWNTVVRNRHKYLYGGLIGFSLLMIRWLFFEDSTVIHFTEAGIKVFNLWSWILTLFGFSAFYLNKPSRTLSYVNEAVYPFYILHQTIIIIIGFYLMDANLGLLSKFSIMVIGTFGVTWLMYEFLIRRWRWIRPLFGVKNKSI